MTYIFFQDRDDWIRWGVYHLDSGEELIFTRPVNKAQTGTPLACCRSYKEVDLTIHLFFVDDEGILSDVSCIISHEFPPTASFWVPDIREQNIRIIPGTTIAACRSTSGEVIVVFEQHSTPSSSKLFEAHRSGNGQWSIIRRMSHRLHVSRGSPLNLIHKRSRNDKFRFIYQCESLGCLTSSTNNLKPASQYTSDNMLRAFHLAQNTTAMSDNCMNICFAANRFISQECFVAIRRADNTIVIRKWADTEDDSREDPGDGGFIRVSCITEPETRFHLVLAADDRLLLFYVAVSGRMEIESVNIEHLEPPTYGSTSWPVFLDCCKRHILEPLEDDSSSDDSD